MLSQLDRPDNTRERSLRRSRSRDGVLRGFDGMMKIKGNLSGHDRDTAVVREGKPSSKLFKVAGASAVMMTPEAQTGGIAGAIWSFTVQNHALLLSCRNAHDRIVAFLEDMDASLNRASAIELPMSRQDIADYLGPTIETASRALADLARRDATGLPRPRPVLLRKAMRARLANTSQSREPAAIAKLVPATRPN